MTILLAMLWRVWSGDGSPWLLLYGLGQLALVAWALRPNIARLLAGNEIRVDPSGDANADDEATAAAVSNDEA